MTRNEFKALKVGDVVRSRFGTQPIVQTTYEFDHADRDENGLPTTYTWGAFFPDGTCLKLSDPDGWIEQAEVVEPA